MKIFKIIILITIFLIIAIIHVSIWLYFFGDLIKTDLFWKIIYMCSCLSFGGLLGYIETRIATKLGI